MENNKNKCIEDYTDAEKRSQQGYLKRNYRQSTPEDFQRILQRKINKQIELNSETHRKIYGREWKKMSFTISKDKFDGKYKSTLFLAKSLVPVDGKYITNISLSNKNKQPSEEYYKWQFIYSLLESGFYSKDFISIETYFPKGNKNSAPIKIDGCIFDDKEWITYYEKWRETKDDDSVEWLRKHMIGVIEFKKENNSDIKKVYTSQIKPYLKESEANYCVGFYYNEERLYIFQKKNGNIIRYDESKNLKKEESNTNELSLDLMDGYVLIPTFNDIIKRINKSSSIDRSKRTVDDLDIITGAHNIQMNNAISNILKTLDEVGLGEQEKGYVILIQALTMKIFDEKRSEEYMKKLQFYATDEEMAKFHLSFYISDTEKNFLNLTDDNIQDFIERMRILYQDASIKYHNILYSKEIDWKNQSHIRVVESVVENLQDYSFIRSTKTDLYQIVFSRFATQFTKSMKSQFVTPIPLIDFLVNMVNPKMGETIIDPTVGIADFLSISYVNSNRSLNDGDIYGLDNSEHMVMLATLNMLLNGDGNAIIRYKPDMGSIVWKFNIKKELVELNSKLHRNGNWDNWKDNTELMKFKVVLTNPPFGENRSFKIKGNRDKEIMETYELWNYTKRKKSMDKGLIFLENAYRILDENGRLGIVLSNSIMSTGTEKKDPKGFSSARKWILENLRVVATFDLPANVFADTGVNTTLLIAYKPKKISLNKLKNDGYQIFTRDVKRLGYEIRTKNRVKIYNRLYKINEKTFDIEQDEEGNPKLDEEFSDIVKEFKDWVKTQEQTLKDLFL